MRSAASELDFWPFRKATNFPSGESREPRVDLPSRHDRASVDSRYRDWFTASDRDLVFSKLEQSYLPGAETGRSS
jgi:hypothetical protein